MKTLFFLMCLLLQAALGAGQSGGTVGLRVIAVDTESLARDLQSRIDAGESFESIARRYSVDPSGPNGGNLGAVVIDNLRDEFRSALTGLDPGRVSAVTPAGDRYYLLQLLTPGEQKWADTMLEGLDAVQRGRLADASRLYSEALEGAESFPGPDFRLARTLDLLAEVVDRLGRDRQADEYYARSLAIWERVLGSDHPELAPLYDRLADRKRAAGSAAEAASLYARALEIRERQPDVAGPEVAQTLNELTLLYLESADLDAAEATGRRALEIWESVHDRPHPDLAAGLNNLARVLEAKEAYVEAERLYGRALEILENTVDAGDPRITEVRHRMALLRIHAGAFEDARRMYLQELVSRWGGSASPDDVLEVLERFSGVLAYSYFRDARFEQALSAFSESLEAPAFAEEFYSAIARILLEAGVSDAADLVLRHAIRIHSSSVTARFERGRALRASDRAREAIAVYEGVREGLAGGASTRLDPGIVDMEIGDAYVDLLEFEAAAVAYERALDARPGDVAVRVALGDVSVRRGLWDDARGWYAAGLDLEPANARALVGLAETDQQLERFADSLDTIERILEIEPGNSRALYLRGVALLRTGREEEGRRALAAARTIQAEEQSIEDQALEFVNISVDVAKALSDGRNRDAIRLFEEAIVRYPDAAPLYLNLALLQSEMGFGPEAVRTLRSIIDHGVSDDFLVHWALARELGASGAPDARRHAALFLERIGTQLARQ